MNIVERRRSPRVPAFHEEAAVFHSGSKDIPVKLIDLSRTGLSFSFLELSSLPDADVEADERIDLSMAHFQSVLQIKARVVRRTRVSVAVEFIEVGEEISVKLEEKLRSIEGQNQAQAKARAATVS